MSRPKRKREDMYYDIVNVSSFIHSLSAIVQNDDMEVSDEDIQEWSDNVNRAINKLSSLREDVFRFYQD